MIRLFEDANIKLSSVFSNIRGKTCNRVIDAVIAGDTDPQKLTALCTHRRLKSSQEEIGVDMEVFPTAEHLTSWAGLAPGNNESAGKKSSHTNHGNKVTKAIMTECAWCATRSKRAYFSARYKRLAARRGKRRALVAIAAEMLKVVYRMLKDGTAYQELGEDYMVLHRKDTQIKYHREQLKKLFGEDSP